VYFAAMQIGSCQAIQRRKQRLPTHQTVIETVQIVPLGRSSIVIGLTIPARKTLAQLARSGYLTQKECHRAAGCFVGRLEELNLTVEQLTRGTGTRAVQPLNRWLGDRVVLQLNHHSAQALGLIVQTLLMQWIVKEK